MKRVAGALLCLAVLMGLLILPASAAEEQPLAVLYAGSDFQFPNSSYQGSTYPDYYEAGAAVLRYVLDGIRKENPRVDEALFLGDYEPSSYTSDPSGLKTVQRVLQETWGLKEEAVLYLQGNHDHYDMPGLDGARMVFNEHYNYGSKEGTGYIVPLEREHYSICMIHHDAFPETRTTDAPEVRARKQEAVRETAQALEAYLTVSLKGSSKPVIIMGHLPLHYSRQDNLYARYLVDALNTGAAAGRNIIYLFGHNHSGGYDNYLGGSCVYQSRGTQIPVPDAEAADRGENLWERVPFDFTYLNAGYVGFVSSGEQGTTLSSVMLRVYEDRVELTRYNGRGKVNLKNESCANTAGKGKKLQPLYGVISGPETLRNSRLELSLEAPELLEAGCSQRLEARVTGAAGVVRVEWESGEPEIAPVSGSGFEARVTGVSEGRTTIRVRVTDDNGFSKETVVPVAVRPREAVRLPSGDWLWCSPRGSRVAGADGTDAFVTRLSGEEWIRQPLTPEMLTGCDPDTPGVYRCTVTLEGLVLREDFLLTVWPSEAVEAVKTLSVRDLYVPAQRLVTGQRYAILGTAREGKGYAMGIRSFGSAYRTVSRAVELFDGYAAIPGDLWSWRAQGRKTDASRAALEHGVLKGYLSLGRGDFLTLTGNAFDAPDWSLTGGGLTTRGLGLACSAGAFYTGQGNSTVTLWQKEGSRLITYGYVTAAEGTVTARQFARVLQPGGELVLSGRLDSDGSQVFTKRVPITVTMLTGITLEDLLTPGTYTCNVCYEDAVVYEGYTLTVE